eukprot:TRINITY_DN238_c0_g1_i1.p1 TRINITY_DN238_c0_g1~~TRINITY_DN238_c0_g1_i1.p1  ORF type:complete len:115 (+),score=31.88 TRINITY_DN238_c0_g1_i1:53-346(+)
MLVEPDSFLNKVNQLFEKTKDKGTVWITFKKHTPFVAAKSKKESTEHAAAHPTKPEPEEKCMMRVTDGKKKFSTIISAREVVRFQLSFSTICKAHRG